MRRIRTRRRAAIALLDTAAVTTGRRPSVVPRAPAHHAAHFADLGSVASARPARAWDRAGRATATDERQRGETR